MPSSTRLRRVSWLLAGLSLLFVMVWQAPAFYSVQNLASYLSLHMAAETFSIVVSMLVFGIAWNAYSRERAGNVMILACALCAVGLIDFAHMLSYKGMPVFITPGSEEKAINFWLSARFLAALTLLVVAFRDWRPLADPRSRYALLVGMLAVALVMIWLGLFHPGLWPHTFLSGQGLTPFKIESEDVIVGILMVPAVRFYQLARQPQSFDATSLFAATFLTILSELSFTLYSDVADVFNLLGHLYKILAYAFIYRAVFVASVREPFQRLDAELAENRRIAKALRSSEALLHSIVEHMPAMVFLKSADGLRFELFNRAGEQLLGYDRRDLLGKNDADIFPAGQADAFMQADRTVLADHRVLDLPEEPIKSADGSQKWLHTLKTGLYDADGKPTHLLGISLDISEQKRIAQALAESDYRFSQLFENMPEAFAVHEIICDDGGNPVDYRFLEVNPAFETLTGIPADGLIGKAVLEVLPGTEAYWIETYGKVALTGEPVAFQNYAQALDRYYDVRAFCPREGQFATIFRDVTDQVNTERELARNEEKYRRLVENSPGIIYEYGIKRGGMYYSSQVSDILGYPPESLYTDPFLWQRSIHPDDVSGIEALLSGLHSGSSFNLEYRIRGAQGDWIWLHDRSIGVRDESGELIVTGLAVDITELKRTQTALEHANRALMTLSAVNRELMHTVDEVVLMGAIATAIVEQGGYRMAWVGYARDNADKDVEVVADAGVPKALMDVLRPGWGEDVRASGPTGRAIRTGKTQRSQNLADEPDRPWKEALRESGCVSSVALPLKARSGRVFGVLHVYSGELDAFTDKETALLEEMAGDLAFGVDALRVRLERDEAMRLNEQHLAQLRLNLEETITAISKAVEARDPYTAGHQRRVAELAVAIGRRMGLDEETLQGVHMGGTIHDVGKINIPAEILSKPDRLSEIEAKLVQQHPQVGYEILKDIDFPWPVAEIAHQHHERFDGSGYPQGLKGEQICLEARIVAVADVVEAMSSHRPYRAGLGIEAALAEIGKHKGTLYDAGAVDACLAVFADGFLFH